MTPLREFEYYTLLGQIAEGGMGVVYQAVHRGLNRSCALKLIRTGLLATPDERRRFVTEAEAAAKLDHPNIVRVSRAAEFEGQWFLEMELVEGGTLADRIAEGPLPPQETARLLECLARAVQHAHERGILHRDLKPANVLLAPDREPGTPVASARSADGPRPQRLPGKGEIRNLPDQSTVEAAASRDGSRSGQVGQPKLTDFGLARFLEKDSDLTRTIAILGTPAYLAPELASGRAREATTAADIYSLGVILFECLTGQRPFQGQTPLEILRAVQDAAIPRPSSLRADVPLDLETICLKCLEKEPAKRYATAQAIVEELNRYLHDEPIHARPVGGVEKAWRWCRRKPALAASFAALAVALALGFIGVLTQWQRAERHRHLAELQSHRAEDNAANERRERYYASITAADSHIRNGDIDVALSVLTNCPSEFRHWEWGRLLYLCHQSISSVRLPKGNAESLIVNAAGTRAIAAPLFRSAQRSVCWDVNSGAKLFEVASETNSVVAMTFSPDGERLAVALLNGLVTIREPESGRQQLQFRATNEVQSLQFNPDGTHVAITFRAGGGILLDAATGQLRLATPAVEGRFRSAALDPSGRFWATMDDDAIVIVHDARTGKARFSFQGYAELNPASYRQGPLLAFSPDGGRLLAHASEKSVKVWNVETGRELLFIPAKVFGLAFDPDGSRVAIFSGGKTAELWNLVTGEKSQTVYAHQQRVNFVGFDRSRARLRTASADGVLKTWPARPGREWIPHSYNVDAVAFRPDGERFITTQFDGLATIRETASGRELLTFRGNWSWLRAASFSPDGKRIVTGGADRLARIFEADTGRELLVMKGHTSAIRTAAFSPDGRKVATGGADNLVKLWDAATGTELFTLRAHIAMLKRVAFTPDGAQLITLAHDPTPHVWDVATGRHLRALAGGRSELTALALSPDGRRLVTGSTGGSLRLWDLASGTNLARWQTRASVQLLDFTPDGKRLAVVTSDSNGAFIQPSIEIWDVEAGRSILALSGHPAMILGAKFSPDGKRLLTGSYAYGARFWETFPWDEKYYPDAQATHGARSSRREEAQTSTSQLSTLNSEPLSQSLVTSAATPLLDRVNAYAESYWSDRLAAESGSNLQSIEADTPPTSSVRRVTSVATNTLEVRYPKSDWPVRNPAAARTLLNLTPHYNALLNVPWEILGHEIAYDDDLSDLPTGLVTLAEVPFDVRGLVCLASATNSNFQGAVSIPFHSSIQGIPVGFQARRIHALHGTERAAPDGTLLARFVLHYADGTQAEIPVHFGRDVRENWELDNDIKPETDRGIVAWRGTNPAVARRGGKLRLYLRTFDNPRPELEIKSIDLVSAHPPCVLFLIALTLEP